MPKDTDVAVRGLDEHGLQTLPTVRRASVSVRRWLGSSALAAGKQEEQRGRKQHGSRTSHVRASVCFRHYLGHSSASARARPGLALRKQPAARSPFRG